MILLTGATGYIASHTWLALHEAGMRVVGLDNFCNSSPEVLRRLGALGADVSSFVQADVTDRRALQVVFERFDIRAVVHFAALKAVGQSVAQPLLYYANNVGGLVSLAETMQERGCKTFVFSSSATVYGEPETLPLTEDARLAATSPYGSTKLIGESILRDIGTSDPAWHVAVLRYFNPVGAHVSGSIGEDPNGVPNNLMPFVAQVAVGRRKSLQIFGGDYATPDGTGVRDYLHVEDLAAGHVAALRRLLGGADSFHRQPRHGARRQRARPGQSLRARQRAKRPLRDRRPAGRRRCCVLRRPDSGRDAARVEGPARSRCDVRRQLALAAG